MTSPSISIIIPILNEEKYIGRLLEFFRNYEDQLAEVIVIDGGSIDTSCTIVEHTSAILIHSNQGRALQMNLGAKKSSGDILYFVHADTIPPIGFLEEIRRQFSKGLKGGCFSYQFDPSNWLLRMNSYLTQFDHGLTGGGDQTLFICRSVFQELGGFDEDMIIMEDFDLVKRMKQKYSFGLIKKDVTVSSRKYENNSWLRVQFANSFVVAAYRMGASQQFLVNSYSQLLH